MKGARLAPQKRSGSLPHAARYPQLVVTLELFGCGSTFRASDSADPICVNLRHLRLGGCAKVWKPQITQMAAD